MAEGTAERFRAIASSTVDDLLRLQPEQATDLGDHRFDDRINDLSAEGLSEEASVLRRRRDELEGVEVGALEREDAVDHAMLLGEIDRLLFEIEEIAPHTWDPLAYHVGEAIYPLVSRNLLPLDERLRAIAARLDAVPDRLALARRQLEAPPQVHVETALAQHPGTVAMLGEKINRLLGDDPGLRPLVEAAQRRALAALEDHEAYLRQALEGPHRDFRIGAGHFERRLALALHTPLAPGDLVAHAEAHLLAVEAEIAEVAGRYLGREGTVREALDAVSATAPNDETIVDKARETLSRVIEAVRELGIVTVPDDAFRVELMPAFRRGVAGAYCDPAGPLEEGGETSLAIAPTPDEWSEDEKASYYREMNDAMLVDLMAHEAVPGHMLQLALARRFHGSSLARSVLWSGPFVEGWAVHAERLLADSGFGGPAVKLQQLKMQLRMAINAVLDVSVHAGDLDEEGAYTLMTERGMQEDGEARNKWRRVCLTSAQLSTYFVGYLGLEPILAESSDLDSVLAHGSPPPPLLGSLL